MKISTLRRIEIGIIFVLLLYFSGAMAHADSLEKLMRISSYPILLLLISIRWKKFIYVLTQDIPLLLLVLMALISVLWSVSPVNTLEHGKGVLRSTLLGVYLATTFSQKEQLRLYAWVLGIAALLSVAIAVALPGLGVQGGKFAGLWRGAFIFKNILGRTMNLSAEIFLLLALSSKRYSRILWAGFGLSVFLILRSGSTTALAVLLLVSSLLPLYKFLQQRQYKLQVVVITFSIFLVGSVAALIVVNAATLVGATGKDLTFSGRTELWPVLVEFIGQRFWLGYGYEAFWPSHGFFISNMQNWEITHAHNGYLDLSLSLGLIGVSLYALSFVSAFLRAVTQMFTAQKAEHFWPLQLLVMLLVFELTIETTILSSTSIWWIAYVSTALSLAVQQRRISRARLASENSLVNF